MNLFYISKNELRRIRESEEKICNLYLFASLTANIARFNALYMIQILSLKYPGFCDSAIDVEAWLYTQILKNPYELIYGEICDSFLYSGGHYAPAFWALQTFLGKEDNNSANNMCSSETIFSKSREIVHTKRFNSMTGRTYALIGEEILQKEPVWKLLCQIANENLFEITSIIDHDKTQSGTELARKFYNCGWEAAECDGHNFKAIDETLRDLRDKNPKRKPQVLIVHTKKFIEKNYESVAREIKIRIDSLMRLAGLGKIIVSNIDVESVIHEAQLIF